MSVFKNDVRNSPVDQTRAIETAKPSYGFASSRAILDVFESKGWTVDKIETSNPRTIERQGFQKHLVWLKNESLGPVKGLTRHNESVPRLCLVNAHDYTSSLMIFLGVLRIACLNQLATGSVFRFLRAVHSQSITTKVAQGIDFVTDGIPELIENLQRLQSIQLDAVQRSNFAHAMINMRLSNVKNLVRCNYSYGERILRKEDEFQDAYTVMNRIQELVIRGGIPYSYEREIRNDEGNIVDRRLIHTVTRKVASIPTQLKLNRALFEEIKKVA